MWPQGIQNVSMSALRLGLACLSFGSAHRRRLVGMLGIGLLLAVGGCGGQRAASVNELVRASPTLGSPLGTVEIEIAGLGTPTVTSGLGWIDDGSAGADGRAHALAVTTLGSGLDFKLQSASSIDVGTRGAGGMRYIAATYLVRNAQACSTSGTCTPYGVARQNITFLGVITPTSVNQTAVGRFARFDGSDAAAALATQLVPTHGMNATATVVDPTRASLQLYRESELPATASGGVSVLPYGFVVSNANDGSRTLPANPAAQQFDGQVTFAFKIPLQPSATDDPFKISVRLQVTEDSNTRVTQSTEEASAAGDAAAAARAAALGTTDLIVPCGRTVALATASALCDVRIAGLPASPTATMLAMPKDSIPLMVNTNVDCYWCNFPLFVNLVNSAEAWRYNWDTAYDPTLLEKDANGWVTKINGTGVARVVLGYAVEAGAYRVSWKGKGRLQILSNQNSSVNVDVVATGDGTQTFNIPAPAEIRLDILSTNATDYLRDIVVVAERYAATYVDQPFYPATLNYLKNFRGLRFMDFLVINNSSMVSPADRVKESYYSQSAIAGSYEMAIRLCNAAARDCWLNIPHQANDAFVTEVATLVRDRLDPKLKVYVEYSNEAWNYGFQQAAYMRDQGVALNLAGGDVFQKGSRYYARRSVQIFGIFQQVLGTTGSQRLVRVLAGQSGGTFHGAIHLNEAAGRLDAYAVAPYVGNDSNGGFGGAALSWNLTQLFSELNGNALNLVISDMQAMQTLLSANNVPMIGYEGGQHLVDWGGNSILTNLYISANRDARMGTLYGTFLDRWRAAGGREMALYHGAGLYSQYGSWGLKENVTQPDAQSPKLQSVVNWMARNPKWW